LKHGKYFRTTLEKPFSLQLLSTSSLSANLLNVTKQTPVNSSLLRYFKCWYFLLRISILRFKLLSLFYNFWIWADF
jgi:hypothetical protein